MDGLQEKIVNLLDAHNGSMTWQQMIEGLEYPERQFALQHVRALEAQGVLKRNVTVLPNGGGTSFTLDKVGA